MTPTPAGLSKKLEAALKKAGPKELARIMHELRRPEMEKVLDGKAPGIDPKVTAQQLYIQETFIQRLPVREWIEYRNELAWLTELALFYRLQVKDVLYMEALLVTAEHFLLTLEYLEQGFFEAGYELGEDETREEDLETSPLKPFRDDIAQHTETAKERLRQMIKRRAELCLSSIWEELGRPCPFDPAYDSGWASREATLGQPVPGSKEAPLDPREVLAAAKAREAALAEKGRRKRAPATRK